MIWPGVTTDLTRLKPVFCIYASVIFFFLLVNRIIWSSPTNNTTKFACDGFTTTHEGEGKACEWIGGQRRCKEEGCAGNIRTTISAPMFGRSGAVKRERVRETDDKDSRTSWWLQRSRCQQWPGWTRLLYGNVLEMKHSELVWTCPQEGQRTSG